LKYDVYRVSSVQLSRRKFNILFRIIKAFSKSNYMSP
jgi:hypothetical protein